MLVEGDVADGTETQRDRKGGRNRAEVSKQSCGKLEAKS